MMDVAVSAHSTSDDSDVARKQVAAFIKERGLNPDKVYSEYCTYFLSNFIRSLCSIDDADLRCGVDAGLMNESTKVIDLSRRVCLVASWIKSLDYRCKVRDEYACTKQPNVGLPNVLCFISINIFISRTPRTRK